MLGVAALLVLAGVAAAADKTASEGVFEKGRFESRLYRLYVPRALAASHAEAAKPTMIVALHGCWQTPEDFALGTGLNEAAERRNVLVLYPAQGRRENISRCWNWFEPLAPGSETSQLAALIRHVADARRVATDRIAVVGFSAGGYMAVNLACTAPELVRAVGVHSGGPFRCGVGLEAGVQCMRGQNVDGEAAATACRAAMKTAAHPIRASLWHGANDVVVNPVNVESLVKMFSLVDGVSGGAAEPGDGAQRTVYRDSKDRAWIEAWLVPGMGHAWSGGDMRATHTFPPGPNATQRMLDFLLE